MTLQPSVLYVEDDWQSRMVMEILLVEEMHLPHVTIFEDSTDFLSKIAALDPLPDVVLLDIHMKPHDGFEMLKMLRTHPAYKDKPVVALTASVMNEEVVLLEQAGFNGVVAKPIEQEAFPGLLERIVKGERLWNVRI
jgi:CheY-like chemotaxis protein